MRTTLQRVRKNGDFKCNLSQLKWMVVRVHESPQRVYNIIQEYGGIPDTVTRETVFSYIASKYYKGNYDKIYKRWLVQ